MQLNSAVLYCALAAAVVFAAPAWAHGDSTGTKARRSAAPVSEAYAFGQSGDPKKVTRSIAIDMSDTMRFTPAALTIQRGETIRFVVRNSGRTMHEFVLGTLTNLKDHAEMMKKHPGMEHDEPYMAHVAPGKTGTIVWQFSKSGEFHFGCLLPGHFEAGMVGKINVTQR